MRSLTLGRLFGIKIQIDWSWLLILVLITWNLSVLFGNIHPDWTAVLRWSTALLAALLFFLSVLAHELAHALMAQVQGIPVRNIILFLLGGVANIQREPPSPRAEFLITIVGPLASFVIGIFFTILGSLLGAQALQWMSSTPTAVVGQLSPLTTILLWLGPINILLAVFNLIPGFPLDGGRLLRALLWAITDNLRLATRWATLMGQIVAWVLIIGGIAMVFGVSIPFFGTGLGGLWLAFIGWFLHTAARQSYRQVVIQSILEDVSVRELMRRDPTPVAAEATVDSLVNNLMKGTDENTFPVVENGRLLGLIRLEDILNIPPNQRQYTAVHQAMTPIEEFPPLSPTEGANEALQKLQERQVGQLPVMDNGHLTGLLRRRDILRWLQLQSPQ